MICYGYKAQVVLTQVLLHSGDTKCGFKNVIKVLLQLKEKICDHIIYPKPEIYI